MSKLYSTKPTSNNKDMERAAWEPSEQLAIGKVVIVILIVIPLIGIFVLHLQLLLVLLLVVLACIFTAFVMKNAHNKAFERYWSYWQEQDGKTKDKK